MSHSTPASYPHLSRREYQVLSRLVEGRRPKEIAEELKLSVRTINYILLNLRNKLRAHTLEQAIGRAVALHLYTPKWIDRSTK